MGWVALVLWMVLAAGLPDLLPQALGLSAHGPDLWVALVVYMACLGRGYAAVGPSILVGLLRDAQSLDPLGTHGFVLGMVSLFLCEGRGERGRLTGVARAACVALGSLAASWLYLLRLLPMGGGLSLSAVASAFPSALWTSLFALPFFATVDRLHAFDDLVGRRHGLPA